MNYLLPLLNQIEKQLDERKQVKKAHMGQDFCNKPLVIAIDGCCGSGKTHLATALCEYFGASCIHCDDFFLPFEMRTVERYAEVGGNVHYERLAEVLNQVVTGSSFVYQAYDCSTGKYVDRQFDATDVVVVEGSYSLHPTLTIFYDVKFVLTVDKSIQIDRLTKREGGNIDSFINKWIPLENRYLNTLNLDDCIVVDTGRSECN